LPFSILIGRFLLPLNHHNIILNKLRDKSAVAVRREPAYFEARCPRLDERRHALLPIARR
jgi:hypothetical protein